ncbi:MAG: hemolysin family protein [Alphaproteobacteria bacterium]
MTLLFLYLLLAVGVSFFCSISEAVLLSVRQSYIAALENNNIRGAKVLKKLNDNLDRPLAAILTANTISHTVGAAGIGAQATMIFGNAYLGVISALLTIIILVFSEIIPKTIGATYWKQLAPTFGYLIDWLVKLLFPMVWLSEKLTKLMSGGHSSAFTFSRDEMQAMVEIGKEEGLFNKREHKIFSNLMKIREISIRNIMTPRTVVYSLPQNMAVEEYFNTQADKPFSRIPIYKDNHDDLIGYVLKIDLLTAQAKDDYQRKLVEFMRDFVVMPDKITVFEAYNRLINEKSHIALIVDEYGTVQGLVTLEDVLETIIGLEITDESDTVEDMQILAQNRWRNRIESIDSIKSESPAQPAATSS